MLFYSFSLLCTCFCIWCSFNIFAFVFSHTLKNKEKNTKTDIKDIFKPSSWNHKLSVHFKVIFVLCGRVLHVHIFAAVVQLSSNAIYWKYCPFFSMLKSSAINYVAIHVFIFRVSTLFHWSVYDLMPACTTSDLHWDVVYLPQLAAEPSMC